MYKFFDLYYFNPSLSSTLCYKKMISLLRLKSIPLMRFILVITQNPIKH